MQLNFIKNLKNDRRKNRTTRQVNKYTPPANFTPSDTSGLAVGMKVEHPKFGYGKVVAMDENGAGRKAKVHFDNFGEKTLLLSFAKLKIHS